MVNKSSLDNVGQRRRTVKKPPKNLEEFVERIRNLAWTWTLCIWDPRYTKLFSHALLVLELILCSYLIKRAGYTEIDWKAYMQEVEGFLNGTLDYFKLQGDTGPLVYPAGFVYIFSAFYYITDHGKDIRTAQWIFGAIYLLMLVLVFRLYIKCRDVPPYVLVLMCALSYRIHSIFILRMFNDCVAMLLFFASANLFVDNRWLTGCFLFSSAVSVKMNVLLFAPGLLFLLLSQGIRTTAKGLAICGGWQVILAIPFLIGNPWAYVQRSFDLGRMFLYEWTVNWRFLDEKLFIDRRLHLALLVVHLVLLGVCFWRIWAPIVRTARRKDAPGVQAKLMVLFTSNLIGIACSRSLHYQFYVWYFHTLHFILWTLPMQFVTRILILGMVEYGFNVYPSTNFSSAMLVVSHVLIIGNLLSRSIRVTDKITTQPGTGLRYT